MDYDWKTGKLLVRNMHHQPVQYSPHFIYGGFYFVSDSLRIRYLLNQLLILLVLEYRGESIERMAKSMFNSTLKQKGVASIEELRSACIEAEVKMVACQMTVDLFGYDRTDFVPEVAEWVGAAAFFH